MHSALIYRPEIDGLRAIAVLFVIAFHSGFGDGGYLGVDIFFVISGYLIGSIIIKERAEGKFTIRSFLDRRFRRIIPALIILCFVCIIPAWLLLPPSDFKDFTESIAANLTLNANHLFFSEAGYFDQKSDLKPLLHTWSLSVELQFYCLVAITVVTLNKLNDVLFYKLFLIAGSLSAFSFLLYSKSDPDLAFYLLPTRLWEFFIGILASIITSKKIVVASWLSTLGLAIILASLLLYDFIGLPQPLMTIITVLSTGLLILSAKPNSFSTRVLSTRVLVGIGIISYSLYLVHNPILSFTRYISFTHKYWLPIATLPVMLVLALLSWKFIEKPFRDRRTVSGKSFYKLCSVCLLGSLMLGISSDKTNGFLKLRLDTQQAKMQSTATQDKRDPYCQTGGENYLSPLTPCALNTFDKIPPTWAIFGDSHAGSVAYALADTIFETYGEATQWLSMRGSPPEILTKNPSASQRWISESIGALSENTKIHTVIVVYRLNVYFYGSQIDAYPLAITKDHVKNRSTYWKGFYHIISSLQNAGKRVIVISPIPEPRRNIRDLIFQEGSESATISAVKLNHWQDRNEFTLKKLNNLDPNILVFYPENVFCNAIDCNAVEDGKSYYYDHNHLSTLGAQKLANHFINWVQTNTKN